MIPKITGFELFQRCFIGLPILPITLTGENGFSISKSKFELSYAKADEVVADANREKNPKNEIWTISYEDKPLSPFTPTNDFKGYILRLTCTPWNEAGNQSGIPSSVETQALTHPPSQFIFRERLSRMDRRGGKGFFRVVSYNTLSDPLATETMFKTSPKGSLTSDFRIPALCAELKAYKADIICMQEVDKKYFETYFERYLCSECGMDGYLSLKIEGEKIKDGQAMFFNRQKFECLEKEGVVLSGYMKTLDFFKDDSLSPGLKNKLNSLGHIFQVVVLKSNDNPNSLLVIGNTHQAAGKNYDHIRLLQTITAVSILESKVQDLKTRFPQLKSTVLLFGDFNCPANSPIYGNGSFRYLSTGRVQAHDVDWTKGEELKVNKGICHHHTLNFKDSHPKHEKTNFTTDFKECIDYIFYQDESVKLLKAFPPPLVSIVAELCKVPENEVGLPNYYAPSDHLPLIVDFNFKC